MDIQSFQTALLQNLQGTLLAWGVWGPLAGFALSALRPSLPFPLFLPVSLANGIVFGPWVGFAISWTGTAAGSCIGFSISRRMGQPVIYRWMKAERWRKLEDWVARKGFIAVILGRLTPAIPYGPFSYVVGVSPMALGPFLGATLLGTIPGIILSNTAGDYLRTAPLWVWGLFVAIYALLSAALLWRGRQEMKEINAPDSQTALDQKV